MRVPTPSREALRSAAALLLTLLGISGVAGAVLGSTALNRVGQLFLVAPVPAVFTDRYISAQVEVMPLTGERPRRRLELDRAAQARIGGPLSRTDAYAHAILGLSVLPWALTESVLRHGFCREGPLGQALSLPADLPALDLRLSYRSAPLEFEEVRVPCTPGALPEMLQ